MQEHRHDATPEGTRYSWLFMQRILDIFHCGCHWFNPQVHYTERLQGSGKTKSDRKFVALTNRSTQGQSLMVLSDDEADTAHSGFCYCNDEVLSKRIKKAFLGSPRTVYEMK